VSYLTTVVRVDSAHLEADMAVCEQRSFHLDDGGLLVSTNQLEGCSTDALRLIWQTVSDASFCGVEYFGQGVKGTGRHTHTHTHKHTFK